MTQAELDLLATTNVLQFIKVRNEARNWQAKKEGWTFWTLIPENEEFVSQFANAYELEHMYACETYSDVYKDVYGVRPRHSYSSLTLTELSLEIEELAEQVQVDEE